MQSIADAGGTVMLQDRAKQGSRVDVKEESRQYKSKGKKHKNWSHDEKSCIKPPRKFEIRVKDKLLKDQIWKVSKEMVIEKRHDFLILSCSFLQ